LLPYLFPKVVTDFYYDPPKFIPTALPPISGLLFAVVEKPVLPGKAAVEYPPIGYLPPGNYESP